MGGGSSWFYPMDGKIFPSVERRGDRDVELGIHDVELVGRMWWKWEVKSGGEME